MSGAVAVIRQAGEGERMWFAGGGVFTWKATAAETGGAFLMFEDHMERGKVTPYHAHPEQDETIYVLDGELVVNVEGQEHRVASGGLFIAPRGVPHAFMVTSERAHILTVQTPGSGESFYRECGEPVAAGEDPRPADWERLRRVAERSSCIEILGPPPFDTAGAQAPAATR